MTHSCTYKIQRAWRETLLCTNAQRIRSQTLQVTNIARHKDAMTWHAMTCDASHKHRTSQSDGYERVKAMDMKESKRWIWKSHITCMNNAKRAMLKCTDDAGTITMCTNDVCIMMYVLRHCVGSAWVLYESWCWHQGVRHVWVVMLACVSRDVGINWRCRKANEWLMILASMTHTS